MKKTIIEEVKTCVIAGLSNGSNVQFSLNNADFSCFLNALIVLVTKLNYSLLHTPKEILKAIPHQLDKPNIVNMSNTLSELGFITKRKQKFKHNKKQDYPCLLIKKNIFEKDNVRILFYENDVLMAYNPSKDCYDKLDNQHGLDGFNVFTFALFDENKFELHHGVLQFKGVGWFPSLLLRFKSLIIKLVAISSILHLFTIIMPLYIIYVYSSVLIAQDISNFMLITAIVVVLLLIEQIIRNIRSNALSWLGARIDYLVTNEILAKFSALSLPVISRLSLPSQVARIRSFASLRDFFISPIFTTLLELPAIFIIICIIGFIHIAFFIVFIALFILMALCIRFFYKVLSREIRRNVLLNTEKYYVSSIFLDKLSTLHYQGLENYYLNKLTYLSEETSHENRYIESYNAFIDNFGKFISTLGVLLILSIGTYLIWHNQLSIMAMLAVVFLSWRVLFPIQVAASTLSRAKKIINIIAQIDDFLKVPDEDTKTASLLKPTKLNGQVRLENVCLFFHRTKKYLLKNFSIRIEVGSLCILKGKSGSGKSSVLNLIAGLEKPNIGKVLLDNHDINQLNLKALRSHICYIQQKEDIITGSVFDNIQIANPLITKKEVLVIAEHLAIQSEINSLAQGIDTHINPENKKYFSSNLLHYIALIRLYVTEASLILIDGFEKYSFNTDTWQVLMTDLQRWKGKKTVVIASEDKLFLDVADKIIDMEK